MASSGFMIIMPNASCSGCVLVLDVFVLAVCTFWTMLVLDVFAPFYASSG